ncbi:hypothetical protein AGMMS49983_20200 [Clostridia bacterium]|nr:hypothetical protein AGMMS49983_20200 [Clostridia bacterium]
MSDYEIDRERWAQLSVIEMMANIGSEVGRAIIAHRAGIQVREDRAVNRAIDLFAATTESLVHTRHAHNLKEVLRSRDEFLRLFFDDTFEDDAENIERYFANISYFARYQSGR